MEQRSANSCRMTINERRFIEKSLLSELRFDGRRPFAYRQLAIKFGSEEGSLEVQLGQTHVVPFVTSLLVQPYRDRPNEGTRSIFTEFSPIADPSFEPGRPGEYAVELGCMVDRGLRESRAADSESLCVLAGRLVWAIRVDLHILDNGGNLVDAANIAALAALMTFRRPECTPEGDNGQEVTVRPPEVKEPLPLIINHLPVAVTFAFFGSGDILVIDPTHYEEAVMGGRMTATINASGDVCAVQKAGGECVMQSVIIQCMRVASLKAADITSKIKNAGSILKGPHGAKSITKSRDCSFDPNEPHWRTNSSFSPPLSRRWDCRFQSNRVSIGDPVYGSSLSSNSKGSRSRVSSDQYPNHHHSVSDGARSYFGSPAESFQAPRWTLSVQKFNFEFATPSAGGSGSRPESSLLPHFSETRFAAGAYAVSNSYGSPSPLSESWESSSKQPPSFMHHNFSSRRSFMSKPVYPLVYQNPVSDSEACGSVDETNCIMLAPNNKRSPMWSESPSSLDLKFHSTLTELQKVEASPDPSMSSRREGFRLMTERLCLENVRLPYNPSDD